MKIAAGKAGVTVVEYQRRRANGMKWCTNCRGWHHIAAFGSDASRWDGLAASCAASKKAKQRAAYTPRPRPSKGRNFVPPRDGDQKQARRRVNYFIEAGLLPNPNSLPCVDCGHTSDQGRCRHEYDHHLGYAAEHHEHVEAVCSTCHSVRERKRRKS